VSEVESSFTAYGLFVAVSPLLKDGRRDGKGREKRIVGGTDAG